MNATSPWVSNVQQLFENPGMPCLYERSFEKLDFKCYIAGDAAWIVAEMPGKDRLAFRVAYSPNDDLVGGKLSEKDGGVVWKISSRIGDYLVRIGFPGEQNLALHLTSSLKPSRETLFPFWPRDIVPLAKAGGKKVAEAEIHVSQVGARSGQLFFSLPDAGSVLYFQDLSSLCHYCDATSTSSTDVVGGSWPEIGFALPVTKDKPCRQIKVLFYRMPISLLVPICQEVNSRWPGNMPTW